MLEEVVNLAAVTVLALLEQASTLLRSMACAYHFEITYFSLQVIYARRKYSVSPPSTVGPPDFERVFRAHANCSEYFPIFVIGLWVSGVFLSQAAASVFGVLYLYGRLMYFQGYSESAHGRLAPLYFSARCLWMLIGLSAVGVVNTMCELYLGLNVLQQLSSFFLQS